MKFDLKVQMDRRFDNRASNLTVRKFGGDGTRSLN